MLKGIADGFFSQPDRHVPGIFRTGENTAILNAGHVFGMDAINCRSLSDGMVRGRKLTKEYVDFFRKYVSGCENMEFMATGALMGIRESRRIVGEYELCYDDYKARRHFPDQIAVYCKQVDIHVYDCSDEQYERYDMVRGIRDKRFKYLRCFMPHRPDGQHLSYLWRAAGTRSWEAAYKAGKCDEFQRQFFERRSPEMLFDTHADPHEVHNLAADLGYRDILKNMRQRLFQQMRDIRDTGVMPEPMMVERITDTTRFEFFHNDSFDYDRVLQVADMATMGDESDLPKMIAFLDDDEEAVRYWAAIGCVILGDRAKDALTQLQKTLDDPSAVVRITAAEAVHNMGQTEEALSLLKDALDGDTFTAVYALNILDFMDKEVQPLLDILRSKVASDWEEEGIMDDRLGPGKSIAIPRPDGSSHHIMLYQDIPFAFMKAVLANPGTTDDRVIKRMDLAKIQLNSATALPQLRALGTAGLTPPDKQPGSYVFLAVADPATRNGVVGACEYLKSLGLTAGIWFMPFAGDRQDPFFADRRHWFVKRADGSPYFARWGGTSLDMTHPEAREYLKGVVRQMVHDWGYKYLKMDGLWVGTASELLYVNNAYKPDDLGDATFHNSEITPIEAYRSGFKLIRETAGDDVFLLGCCISQNMRSFGAAFGLVDAMRIGPDNGSSFDGLKKGAWHGSNRYFLHGRIWYNDPDPVYVRESVPLNHAQLICSWLGVTGQHLVDSDWLPELPDERLDILKRTLPPHNLTPRPVDLLEAELPRIWLLTDERRNVRRDVVGLFNWDGEKPTRIEYPADKLGLPSARIYAGFDYWANEFVPPFSGELCIHLPAGSCRVLALRAMADYPQVVSTSRHITQGILDLLSEEWNEEIGVLRGASRVVAKDLYELRIMVPAGSESWRVQGVELNNSPGGATASFQQEGQKIRVTIQSPDSGQVNWQVQFVRGLIEATL